MQSVDFVYKIQSQTFIGHHVINRGKLRVLMFPDWQGCQTKSAQRLANYYSSVCDAEVILTDVYGKDNRPRSYDDADRIMSRALDNPHDTRGLLKDILSALEHQWLSNGPIFIIGFCFGGSLAFEAGRLGLNVIGVISIHGQPDSREPLVSSRKLPSFLMLHGSEDPFITDVSLKSFVNEMRLCHADWSLYYFGGAKHSFTRNDIPVGNSYMGYNEKADREAVLAVKIMYERLTK